MSQIGLSLIGYESYLTATFALNSTISATVSNVTISTIPMGTTYLIQAKYMYIVTTAIPIDIQTGSTHPSSIISGFLCLDLIVGSGPRTESFQKQTSVLPYSQSIVARSMIYAFNITNSKGSINYLKVASWVTSDSSIHHNVSTDENCTVEFVCITTVIWDQALPKLSNYQTLIETYTYSFTYANNVQQITYYPRFDGVDRHLFGFSLLYQLLGGNRFLSIFPSNYLQINSLVSINDQMFQATL